METGKVMIMKKKAPTVANISMKPIGSLSDAEIKIKKKN